MTDIPSTAMSVVRLEITVAETDAYDLANRLTADYAGSGWNSPYGNVTVDVRTDAEALRDRTILAAARYFLGPQ
jgi:hypothetical protein